VSGRIRRPGPDMAMADLSVVIPAHNEESRIGPTLERVSAYLMRQEYSAEIIVVDDVSKDGTSRAVEQFAGREPPVVLLRREGQNGKGAAVAAGMLSARGKRRLFSDADLSTPIEETEKLLAAMDSGCDISIASRMAPGAQVERPMMRELYARGFNLLVRMLALPGIRDSQCGFKAFTAEAAADLFPRLTITGWAFDVELLFLARKRGWRVEEAPVRWIYSAESKMRPLRDTFTMTRDILKVRWRAIRGLYD
jgi:dolichyl-phosphate beta-glucosyltransferase